MIAGRPEMMRVSDTDADDAGGAGGPKMYMVDITGRVEVPVPTPSFVRPPEPLIVLTKLPVVAWSNATEALFVIAPCRLAVVPTSWPAETIVPPV